VTKHRPLRVRVFVDDKEAISVPLAAKLYGIHVDTMRRTISRLRVAEAITPLPEKLDERTDLYDLEQLMQAMEARPGKGANLRARGIRRK